MKTLKNLAILFIAIFSIVACNKEEVETLETASSFQKEAVQEVPSGEEIDISGFLSQETKGAETRGANTLIFSDTATVGNKSWKLFRYNRSSLLAGYRYNCIITPLTSGDPDLYIYAYDAEKTLEGKSPWRHIRNSITTTIDLSHLLKRELEGNEEAGYFAIYGYSGATFKIEILREDVCGTEDCIGFNTSKVHYVQEGSQYLITDNYSRMLMAPNLAEAKKIVKVLTFYDLNRSCFIGRPDPSFTYYTKNGVSPVGPMPGEDCISFNVDNIEVKQINGRWKIVDGDHWMFDFESNKEEAEQTFCTIKKYRWTKSCFVGRPGPSLQYMRK